MRLFCLTLLLLGAACSDDESETGTQGTKPSAPVKKKEPVSPPTGVSNIQENHSWWAEIFAREQKKETPDPRTLRQVVQGCDMLITALEISIRHDAGMSTKLKHGRMRKELGAMEAERTKLFTEAAEVQRMIDDDAKGVAPIPAGHTRAELEDKIADIKAEVGKLDKKLKEHREEMIVVEKLLQSGERPEPGDTMATRELEAVKELKKKAEALLSQ
jgi:hypothetical protein